MNKLLASVACVFIASTSVGAQGLSESLAFQSRLKQEGFYEGGIDGAVGPATRAAVQEYAQSHGLEAGIGTVIEHIVRQSVTQERRPITNEETRLARDHLEDYLLDSEAARFQDEHAYDVAGLVIICGEVNGRNAYGAYVGYHTYQVTILRMNMGASSQPYAVGDPLAPWVESMCLYGTSMMAALSAEDG